MTYIPERCTSQQITDGLTALLTAVGVKQPEDLAIVSVDCRSGSIFLEFVLSDEKNNPLVIGREAVTHTTEIRLAHSGDLT